MAPVMALDREEKKRLLYASLAVALGLVIPEIAMWPNVREMIIVTGVTLVLVACMLPAAWIGIVSGRLRTICQSVELLRRNHPCDRKALKHACSSFPEDPNIKALGLIPADAPVPIDLLRRIADAPPKAAQTISQLRLFRLLFLVVVVVAGIVRIIHSLAK